MPAATQTTLRGRARPPARGRPRPERSTGRPSRPLHPVTAYARSVVDGKVLAGELVRKACRRHLRDLRTAKARGFYFDEEAASDAIAFFPNLRQSKGRWGKGAGTPLVLQPWQTFVIGCIFGWKVSATGLRRFRTAYVSVARKNGKTTLAAGVALLLLDFDGEPGAEVYAAATKRDQARLCWTEAMRMVKKTPALARRIGIVESRANMHVVETSSKFEALGADKDTLDGLNTHGCIVDELHAHKTRHVVDVLEGSSGAREQPLFLYITTAGIERASIYSEMDDYGRRLVEGAVDDDSWFVYIATQDPDDGWQDEGTYLKSNPSLGVTVRIEDLRKERDKAVATPGKVNAFNRQHRNMRTGQFEAWFTPEQVDANRYDFAGGDLAGWECYLGLDLASTIDITAAVLWFPDAEEGGGWVLPYFWVPEEAAQRAWERDALPYPEWIDQGYLRTTPGDVTDYDVIREEIQELLDQFIILEVDFDPWNATQLVTQLQERGATCVKIAQNMGTLSPAAKHFEGLVAAGHARHDGNPVMRWMWLNAQKMEDSNGNIKPSRKHSAGKIDGLGAWLNAIVRDLQKAGGGASVYDRMVEEGEELL